MTENTIPEQFEVEIDRVRLLRYLRIHGLATVFPLFLFLGALFGLMAGVDRLKHLDPEGFSTQAVAVVISRTGVGIGIGVLLGLGVYLGFVHLGSRRRAYGLRLRIDGMFLHLVRDGITREDRKIHFNKISDYAVTDGPIMRLCGIRGLFIVGTSMSPASLMFIPGVIDAERIRDTLCLIDRQREDRQS